MKSCKDAMDARALGYFIRKYRRTFWQRIADKLQDQADKLDFDPEATADGDYLCFASQKMYSPAAATLLKTR